MELILFIGIQASGKSGFYTDRFSNTHIRLNLDMLKTRHREKILFEACIRAKQHVVIDNTNPTQKDRKRYIDYFSGIRPQVVGYYFKSSIEECMRRNRMRTGKSRIPDKGILSTYSNLELPSFKEGFDKLYYVSIEDGVFQVSRWEAL